MRPAPCSRVFAVALCCATASAQATWIRSNVAAPAPRQSTATAYDANRGRLVLFGGETATGLATAETWEWDGNAWTPLQPSVSPPARCCHAMAYHAGRRRVVLFGGLDGPGGSALADTWEWDGTTWQPFAPATVPPARLAHEMAYDFQRDRVMMFGGRDATLTSFPVDTWEWDGNDWVLLATTGPVGRCCHAMAYCLTTDKVVLFGGWSFRDLDDTWEWDRTQWVRRTVAAPSARQGHDMALDVLTGGVLLYGGTGSSTIASNAETWAWDGAAWTLRDAASAPGPRYGHELVYDWFLQRAMLFGGIEGRLLDDTWSFGTPVPGSTSSYGAGCAGRRGVPALAYTSGPPEIGGAIQLELTSVPDGNVVGVGFGFSRVAWGTLALPFDMSVVGMTGCSVHASPDIVLPSLADAAGRASWSATLPHDLRLIGLRFFNQGWAFDGVANPLGVTVSNAIDAVVGSGG